MYIRFIGRIVALVLLLNLVGCATYRPLPVHEPIPTKVEGKFYPLRGMPAPTELVEAKETLYEYANAYMGHVETLTRANYSAADATMLGGLIGTAGGLTKSPEAAITGTVIAGGAGIFAQRYGLPVQVASYVGAAQAMECMATVLIYGKGPDVAEAWDEEIAPPTGDQVDFAFLNQRIDQVRRRLRSRLASIDISTPDISALKASLTDQIAAERQARMARKDMADAQQAKALAETTMSKEVALNKATTEGRKLVQRQSTALIQAQQALDLAQLALDKADASVKRADRAVIHTSLAACTDAY